jgi:hypothetical protein
MAVESRDARAAKNEAIYREVNERVMEVAEKFEAEGLEALCECSDAGCTGTLPITMTEYALVRSRGSRFALIPGHEDPAIERVVEHNERFLVVEKIGEAGEVAEELNPRE